MIQEYRLTEEGARSYAKHKIRRMLIILGVCLVVMGGLNIMTNKTDVPLEVDLMILGFMGGLLIGIIAIARAALVLLLQQLVITVDEQQISYEMEPLTVKPNLIVRYFYSQLYHQMGKYKSLAWKELDAIKYDKQHLMVKGSAAKTFTGKDILYLPYELENFEALEAELKQRLEMVAIYKDLQV